MIALKYTVHLDMLHVALIFSHNPFRLHQSIPEILTGAKHFKERLQNIGLTIKVVTHISDTQRAILNLVYYKTLVIHLQLLSNRYLELTETQTDGKIGCKCTTAKMHTGNCVYGSMN